MKLTPEQVLRDDVLSLQAYHVADPSGMVKLDAMENPYPLPAAVRARIGALAADCAINRYPDPAASALKARLREVLSIPQRAQILLGNGSDEIIQILAMAVARPGAVILGVEPSFVMFRLIAGFVGARFVGVPLNPDFSLDEPAVLAALAHHRPALAFLAYPNNPTGNLFDRDALTRIIESAPGLVVIDEAYHAFAGESFIADAAGYPNLLVMRTLSKLGLAGLRLGLLTGRGEWLQQLEKLRLPYNINVLTQAIAEAVLSERNVLEQQAEAIKQERTRLFAALGAMKNITAFPSRANFILFRAANAKRLFERLKQNKVLIRNLDETHPLLRDCLRVTVGTPGENDTFLTALSKSL
jgi:histidinol-phosphate aminotransferase